MSQSGGIVGEFFDLKASTDADLLAMQVGDFYEFFDEDAEMVADVLDLKVSQKSSHGSSYPMAGVPVAELTPYLKGLVERGFRVAVADQRSSDDTTREITRVVTPGTLLETGDAAARYLAALAETETGCGIAFADVTTGRFYVSTVATRQDVLTECYRFDPVELLLGPDLRRDDDFLSRIRDASDATVTLHAQNSFAPGKARHALRDHFGSGAIESVALDDASVRAAGAILDYLEETDGAVLASITRLQSTRSDAHVRLDATTQRNLELTEPMGSGGTSLLSIVDHTVTSAGSRLLREWLTRPSADVTELDRRLDAVDALGSEALAREALRDRLSQGADLERLVTRTTHGSADARDLLSIRDTLARLPAIANRVESTPSLADSPVADILDAVDHDRTSAIHDLIDDALVNEPPGTKTDGGLFQHGYDDDLDDVIEEHEAALEWLDSLEERTKRRHGITHCQVDRNTTDGYYVQVGNSETEKVPESFREIKSLKNSTRYTTDELAETEREILRLEERRGQRERALFEELRETVADAANCLQEAGRALAEVDVLTSFATHAVENDWCRPTFDDERIEIERGRHPVVEQTTEFVPNDARLSDDRSFLLVTGPNMSGKSTYMRQVALIVLLAQIGSFVPADSARIDLVDGIFTRVGALDELAQGRSTFMVEMQELSNILHAATEDSLVILDEVGRGTATYDGISIAWAATEYLHNEVRARTLFATHYHELTTLADHLPRVENVHVAAEERGEDVTFLRTVRAGPTDRSYGIHVADLAGIPDPVVERSRDVLERLREEKAIEARGGDPGEPTQVVFDLDSGTLDTTEASPDGGDETPLDPTRESVLRELRETDLEHLSPVDLMRRIEEWQERLSTE